MWLKIRRVCGMRTLFHVGKKWQLTTTRVPARKFSSEVEERKVTVNGLEINYVKTGNGPHPVLLLPGVIGCAWTDFKPQIENLDRTKMTIVAWDPPGCGKSRPPDRSFPLDFFRRDAHIAHELMRVLGFDKFSLIGWSDGGTTSFIMAADYPESVHKMVTSGAKSHITPVELKIYEIKKDLDTWSEGMKAPIIALYGEDYCRKIWKAWVDTMNDIYDKKNGDLCQDSIPKIRCPTLLIHGDKDVVVGPEHPKSLNETISNSKVEHFEKGAHNLHLRYHEEFNRVVTKFLLE